MTTTQPPQLSPQMMELMMKAVMNMNNAKNTVQDIKGAANTVGGLVTDGVKSSIADLNKNIMPTMAGGIKDKGQEILRLLNDKDKLQEIGSNLKSSAKDFGKNMTAGLKESPAAIGAIANAAATGLNALNIGERDYREINRPGYTFNGMATGASLGAMPALAAATGGLSIAAGALIGGAFDAGKFIKGNKQFKKDMYVTRMKKQQDVLDINKFDYTGLAR